MTVLVDGLSPGQNYSFGVRAINEYGVSGSLSGSLSDVVSEVVETEFQGMCMCLMPEAHGCI